VAENRFSFTEGCSRAAGVPEEHGRVRAGCYGFAMEFVWPVIGFLSGIVLWMPFIIGARTDAKLARLEGRLRVELIRSSRQGRSF
jgi:hypothetical protein